jgi:hypothetical protein
MNIMVLKEINDEYVIYLYQPEGRGEYGEVKYSFIDKESKITVRAGEKSVWHDNKALYKIEKLAESNTFPEEFIQAWY